MVMSLAVGKGDGFSGSLRKDSTLDMRTGYEKICR